jgi:hypothetical protein
MPEPKWIRFVELDEYRDRVTKQWHVLPKDLPFPIGVIKWYSGWRRYCLFTIPGGEAIFEEQCLRDIAEFIESVTKAQRETWEKRRKERNERTQAGSHQDKIRSIGTWEGPVRSAP